MGSNAGRDSHTEIQLWLRGVGILCEVGNGIVDMVQVQQSGERDFVFIYAAGSDNLIF